MWNSFLSLQRVIRFGGIRGVRSVENHLMKTGGKFERTWKSLIHNNVQHLAIKIMVRCGHGNARMHPVLKENGSIVNIVNS